MTIAESPQVNPAPFKAELSTALSAITIFLSFNTIVDELIVVWVPSTCKLPIIFTVPVASPIAAGSITKVAGPRNWLNVGFAAESSGCGARISPVLVE